jgi:UDP-N-acetylmuramoyl-L-alanyl-D-glutamate--2,6-diaminopimelate ligase
VAGKGHESGQTIGAVTHPFDDAAAVRAAIGSAA